MQTASVHVARTLLADGVSGLTLAQVAVGDGRPAVQPVVLCAVAAPGVPDQQQLQPVVGGAQALGRRRQPQPRLRPPGDCEAESS